MSTKFVTGLFLGFVITLTATGILVTQTMIPSELVMTGKFYNNGQVYEIHPYGYCRTK